VKLTKKQRAELREMFGGRCAYCGKPLGDRWHADHVEPVHRTPRLNRETGQWVYAGDMGWPERDTLANMMPACVPCNLYKFGFSLEDFRRMLENLPGALERNHSAWRNAARFGMVAVVKTKIVFYFEQVAAERAAGDSLSPPTGTESPAQSAMTH